MTLTRHVAVGGSQPIVVGGMPGRVVKPLGGHVLGMNIPDLNYYASFIPFVDLFLQAAPYDFPADEIAVLINLGGHFPSGVYTIIDDTSTVTLSNLGDGALSSASENTPSTGKRQWTLTMGPTVGTDKTNLGVRLHVASGAPAIGTFHIILPGYASTWTDDWLQAKTKDLFNPAFIAWLAPFRMLRFIKFGGIDGSIVAEWSQRTTATMNQANHAGAALEFQIALCNKTGKPPWFHFPHGATNEYATNMATMIRDHLDPTIPVVGHQFSNEVWNDWYGYWSTYGVGGGQALWAITLAKQLGIPFDPNGPGWIKDGPNHDMDWNAYVALRAMVWRATQVADIMRPIIGARFRHIFGGWGSGAGVGPWGTNVGALSWTHPTLMPTPSYLKYDWLAVAYYLPENGYYNPNPATFPGQFMKGLWPTADAATILQNMQENLTGTIIPQMIQAATDAGKFNLRCVLYEFGYGLVGGGDPTATAKSIEVANNPALGPFFKGALDAWGGISSDPAMIYSGPFPWGSYGCWGTTQFLDDDVSSVAAAPRYKTFADWSAANYNGP